MLGKQGVGVAAATAVAVGSAGASDAFTVDVDEDTSPSDEPPAATPDEPKTNAGPDDAAIEAARKRRVDRRGKRGRS